MYAIFTIDKEEYAADISEVLEIIEDSQITPVPEAPGFVLGILNLRGQVIPAIDLEKLFGLEHKSDEAYKHFLISTNGSFNFAVRVGEVKEVIDIPIGLIKQVPDILKAKISGDYFKGTAVLTGDRVVVLLDFKKLLKEDLNENLDRR